MFTGDRSSSDLVVRVEPWLNRAIAFAKASGLITLEHGKSVRLTDEGMNTLDRIHSGDSVMKDERAFLDAISPSATEAAVERLMRMEPIR